MFLKQKIGSWALLLTFVAAFGLRESHRLFAHAHEEKHTCRDTRPGETHVHDEHFAVHDCDLCGFIISTAELVDYQWVISKLEADFFEKTAAFVPFFFHKIIGFVALRGPPTGL
jgi:hypothetical protein